MVNLEDEFQIDRLPSVHQPVKLSAPTVEQMVGAKQENLQVGDDISARPAGIFRTEQGFGTVSIAVGTAIVPRPLQGLTRTSPSSATAC